MGGSLQAGSVASDMFAEAYWSATCEFVNYTERVNLVLRARYRVCGCIVNFKCSLYVGNFGSAFAYLDHRTRLADVIDASNMLSRCLDTSDCLTNETEAEAQANTSKVRGLLLILSLAVSSSAQLGTAVTRH